MPFQTPAQQSGRNVSSRFSTEEMRKGKSTAAIQRATIRKLGHRSDQSPDRGTWKNNSRIRGRAARRAVADTPALDQVHGNRRRRSQRRIQELVTGLAAVKVRERNSLRGTWERRLWLKRTGRRPGMPSQNRLPRLVVTPSERADSISPYTRPPRQG